MSIYLKILFSILPILFFSFFGAIGTTYYFSRNAIREMAVHWLEIRLGEAFEAAVLQEEMLKKFKLEEIVASARKAQMDAGEMIAAVDVGEKGYAFAVNRLGMVAAHPDPSRISREFEDPTLISEARQGETGQLTFTAFGGEQHFAVYRFFRPWNWYILVATPERELYGALRRTRPFAASMALFGGLGLILTLMLVSRRLTAPVKTLAEVAERIGKGDLTSRISIRRSDELGKLVTAFNRMALRLSETLHALQNSEKHFRRLIEYASDIILLVDGNGVITYASPSVERILGYTPIEYVGKSAFDEVHPEDLDPLKNAFNAMLQRSGVTTPVTCRIRAKDNTWRHLETVANSRLNDPAVFGIIVNARDMTEKMHLEAFKRAKMAAEAASQAKSAFLANMSHEIRTPMNAMVGLIHLVLKTDLTAKQKEYLLSMHRSAEVLLGLINDILDFSKIEEGQLILEEIPFDPVAVVDHVVQMFSERVSEKGLELMTFLSEGLPGTLVGDPLRLEQVLINIVGNAVKFTETGEIVIRVFTEDRNEDEFLLHVSVTDTGIGIAEKDIPRLFSPFTQADGSFTRKYGGTGLGLAISKRIISMMQGEIRVKSTEGIGSEFRFSAKVKTFSEPVIPAVDRRGPWTRRKALVLHGNATFQEMMHRLLLRFGIDTVSAHTLQEAISVLEKARKDLSPVMAFINITLADALGMHAARKIKAMGDRSEIATILMVPFGDSEIIDTVVLSEVNGILEKPVRCALIHRVLCSVFQHEIKTVIIATQSPNENMPLSKKPLRILLVEDNIINQGVQKEILEQAGMHVDVAQNGWQAQAAVREARHDLILMDVQMPVMDGITAARTLRESAEFRDIPIIAMTAHLFSGERERCIAAGMNDYLAKPVDPDLLIQTILRWTRRRGLMEAPEKGSIKIGAPEDLAEAVDLNEALFRMSGKRDLMEKMMRLFVEMYRNAENPLRKMLETGKRKAALDFCHSLKGAAGSISAKAFYAAVRDLESAVEQEGVAGGIPLLERFDTELDRLIRYIEARHPKQD